MEADTLCSVASIVKKDSTCGAPISRGCFTPYQRIKNVSSKDKFFRCSSYNANNELALALDRASEQIAAEGGLRGFMDVIIVV